MLRGDPPQPSLGGCGGIPHFSTVVLYRSEIANPASVWAGILKLGIWLIHVDPSWKQYWGSTSWPPWPPWPPWEASVPPQGGKLLTQLLFELGSCNFKCDSYRSLKNDFIFCWPTPWPTWPLRGHQCPPQGDKLLTQLLFELGSRDFRCDLHISLKNDSTFCWPTPWPPGGHRCPPQGGKLLFELGRRNFKYDSYIQWRALLLKITLFYAVKDPFWG